MLHNCKQKTIVTKEFQFLGAMETSTKLNTFLTKQSKSALLTTSPSIDLQNQNKDVIAIQM